MTASTGSGGARGRGLAELAFAQILRARGGSFAPFHQQVLVHLAATQFHDVTSGSEPLLQTAEDGIPDLVCVCWRVLADALGLDGLMQLLPLVRAQIQPAALALQSDLDQVFRYWAKHKLVARLPITLPGMEGADSLDGKDKLCLEAAVMLRDAVCGALRSPGASPSQPWESEYGRQRLAAISSGPIEATVSFCQEVDVLLGGSGKYALVPAGEYRVWRARARGGRALGSVRVSELVYLARDLVTVAEFAAYLESLPNLRPSDLPVMPDVKWTIQSKAPRVAFSPEFADEPVTGVGYRHAAEYARWFEDRLVRKVEGAGRFGPPLGVQVRIPWLDELQAATGGLEVPFATLLDAGPYGHRHLVGKKWQLSSTIEGNERRTFGGSDQLGADDLSRAKIAYEAFPGYSRGEYVDARDSHTGIRLAIKLDPRLAGAGSIFRTPFDAPSFELKGGTGSSTHHTGTSGLTAAGVPPPPPPVVIKEEKNVKIKIGVGKLKGTQSGKLRSKERRRR